MRGVREDADGAEPADVAGGPLAVQVGVEQCRDRAEPREGEEGQHVVGGVGRVDHHRVARGDAEVVQGRRPGADGTVEFAQREGLPGGVLVDRGVEGQQRLVQAEPESDPAGQYVAGADLRIVRQ